MPFRVRHAFVSPIADSGDPNLLSPNKWNADLVATMASGALLGRPLPGPAEGAVQELAFNADFLTLLNIASLQRGDLIMRGVSGFVRLPPGPSGSFVRSNGPGADLSYGTPSVSSAGLTLGTPLTPSGVAADFTGIPSTANLIIVSFAGLSTNGTANVLLQIGTSGGIETTGYAGTFGDWGSGVVTATDGFTIGGVLAASTRNGFVMLVRLTGNMWIAVGTSGHSDTGLLTFIASSKSLAGALDRVRITTRGGTNLIDAGQINIGWL
jgi:hypothetical protein